MSILRTIYGDNVTTPLNVSRPDWYINPLFLGTFSNVRPGATDNISDLAAPVGTLYFAGEATDADYFSFVHGAYFQGIRAAIDVIKAMESSATENGHRTCLIIPLLALSLLLLPFHNM